MEQNPNPLSDKMFYRITAASTAIGFGCLLAFLFSLRDIRHDTTFVFSATTVISFLIGAVVGWTFWAVVRRRSVKV